MRIFDFGFTRSLKKGIAKFDLRGASANNGCRLGEVVPLGFNPLSFGFTFGSVVKIEIEFFILGEVAVLVSKTASCLLYTSPSPRDRG